VTLISRLNLTATLLITWYRPYGCS